MKRALCTVLLLALSAICAPSAPLFQGEELIFPASVRGGQIFSAVLVTKNKHVVVFDGGHKEDAGNLVNIVKQYSDTIDFWVLTHAHNDHVWALAEFLEKTPDALKVKEICYNFPSVEWFTEAAKKSEKGCLKEAMLILNPLGKTTIPRRIVKKGEILETDGVKIEVLNEPNPAYYHNPTNNSSIVYNVSIGDKKMLVTGDIGTEMSEQLVRECPDKLKADICVLAHHGQNGATKEFYETVKMSIAIWPTPQWLWDNNNGGGPGSGPWKTNYVKCWMQDLGVKRQYNTIKEVRLK